MFKRRKTELEDDKPIMETNDDLGLGKPMNRPVGGLSSGKPPVMPTQPPRPTDTVRPGIEMPRATPMATPTSCDRLIVEGSVEANLANCRDIDIAESGLFKGSASIEEAEIRGRFEGTLTVRKKLFIRSTGKVVGTVRYTQIEIEAGGQLSGDIQVLAGNEPISIGTPLATASFEAQRG
jgi:hypothetical protein